MALHRSCPQPIPLLPGLGSPLGGRVGEQGRHLDPTPVPEPAVPWGGRGCEGAGISRGLTQMP